MNRRNFIKLISGGAAAAFVLDPEQLLWVPGQKTIFIPPERRLIYSSEIEHSEWHTFGVAVGEISVLQKFLYEYKEGQAYKKDHTEFKHVEVYETVKGLHYHPDK